MKNYTVDFSCKLPEYGTVTVSALDEEEADEMGREYVLDTYGIEASHIEIDDVRELTSSVNVREIK